MPHLRFRALITLDPAEARPGVPLRLAAGQRFALWCAGGAGSGVISRRVPGCPPS